MGRLTSQKRFLSTKRSEVRDRTLPDCDWILLYVTVNSTKLRRPSAFCGSHHDATVAHLVVTSRTSIRHRIGRPHHSFGTKKSSTEITSNPLCISDVESAFQMWNAYLLWKEVEVGSELQFQTVVCAPIAIESTSPRPHPFAFNCGVEI